MYRSKKYAILLILFAILMGTSFFTTTNAAEFTPIGPYVDKLEYKVISGDDQQVLALTDNDIDVIGDMVDPSFVPTIQADPDCELENRIRNGYGYLTINTAKYPLNETAFRRAFAFALDKEGISSDVWDGLSVPQDSVIPQVNPFSIEGQLPYTYYEANIALANNLLDAAGFVDTDMDGIREAPDGSDFTVIIETAQSSNIAIEVGIKAEEALLALNIDADDQPTDFYDYLNRLYFHGDYDMCFLGSSFSSFDVDWLAYEFWSEYANEPYWNFPNWRNSTYDSWRDQLLHSTDYDDVHEAATEMQKIWVHACPEVICYENELLSAYRTDKFEGFVNDVSDGVPGFWTNMKTHLLTSEGGPFGGTLRYSLSLDIDSFNPLVSSSVYTQQVLDNLYDSLLIRDPDGNLINWLAESYITETHTDNPAVKSGNTRFTFDIVNNATWSDGTPLTAQDIAFSLNYYVQQPGLPLGTDLSELYAAYAPTDYRLIVEFTSESYWHLPNIAEKPVLPKHVWYDKVWDQYNPNYNELVTSGPFYISSYTQGVSVELTRNPAYFKTASVERQGEFTPSLPPTESPTDENPFSDLEQQIDLIEQEMNDDMNKAVLDDHLQTWLDKGEIDDIVVTRNGQPSIMIYCSADTQLDDIKSLVDVDWSVDLRAFKVIKAFVSDKDSLEQLIEQSSVRAIFADRYKTEPMSDLTREELTSTTSLVTAPDMYEIRNVVGASSVISSKYTGEGVVVGHIDTGCDFGNPDLRDAYHNDSYDPSGYGIVITDYIGNRSYVDPSAWSSEKHVLTYESGGKYYLNVTGWDPQVNNMGSYRHLMGLLPPYGDGYPVGSTIGFVGLYEHSWEINNVSEFVHNQMWFDWEIPAPSEINGNYHFGWIFQQRQDPYTKFFAPVLVYESALDGKTHMIVDWEGADAWTAMWNGALYYESLDLNQTGDRATIYNRMDWNFTDDYIEEVFDLNNPIVAHDFDSDGIDDLSLGGFCWTIDMDYLVYDGNEKMFQGFRTDMNATALYFDDGTHGTATAAHVASRGNHTYYDHYNGTYFTMPGIANESKVMSVRALTSGQDFGAYLWTCGFDYRELSEDFSYTGNHQADFVTNSWGWITEPSREFSYLSYAWTILSTPGYINATYPGVLHVFSSGNEGSGYMTVGPPGCSPAVLTVGASTTNHYLEYYYGPDQDMQGIASFSSKGPTTSGYVKPDVLAPGSRGFSAVPYYGQHFQSLWENGPYWTGEVYNYTLFSGTSQSCPVAAGVVALVIEALENNSISWTPDKLKTIIQSTSDSMGYDPATQGFGQINATRACEYVEKGGIRSYTTKSFNHLADIMDKSVEYLGTGIDYILDGPDPSLPESHPRDFGEGSLFFGNVTPGEIEAVEQFVYLDASDTMLDTFTGWTANAYHMREAETLTFTDWTTSYNCSLTGEQMYGFYNLRDMLGTFTYDSLVTTYSYVTVAVSFDADDVLGGEPWMFLYDWTDSYADGEPNLWNSTSGQGNELVRLGSASDKSNTNMIPFATTEGSLSLALDGDLTLVIHDPFNDIYPGQLGNEFTCTVIFWETVLSNELTALENGVECTYNWSLNVPVGADPGIHLGYTVITNGTYTLQVPYSYNVVHELSTSHGVETVVASGYGDELNPYDTPMYGCMDEDPDDWDFRSFALYNPNSGPGYIGVRVIWDQTGNDMHIALWDHRTGQETETDAKTDTTSALLFEVDGGAQEYYLLLHPTKLNGSSGLPANYTVEVIWYDSIPSTDPTLSYNTNTDPTWTVLNDVDTATGDHVTLNASFPQFNLNGMPEFEVVETTLTIGSGIYETRSDSLVIPDPVYDPFTEPINSSQFAWEYVAGIKNGDNVNMMVDFTNGDSDVMVWYYSIDSHIEDNSTWTYGNNIMSSQMATGAKPEVGSFIADFSGDTATLAIGIFDYDLQSGSYSLEVDTVVSSEYTVQSNEAIYDTFMKHNGTYIITITGETETNHEFELTYSSITLNNWFYPDVTLLSPNGGETWTGYQSISWTNTSPMVDAELTSDVYISNDGGTTYQLFASGISDIVLSWNTDEWQYLTTYMVKVEMFDREGQTYVPLYDSDTSDAVFTAGSMSLSDDTEPGIIGDLTLEYPEGGPGNNVSWYVTDLHPGTIQVLKDDVVTATPAWSSNIEMITLDLDGLSNGIYNYTLVATDGSTNTNTYTTIVTITGSNTAPYFDYVTEDIEYVYDTSGHEIVWSPRDNNPASYEVTNNSVLVMSGPWDGTDISVPIDNLPIGTYVFNLTVYDALGLSASDIVNVEVVTDSVAPDVSSPDDITYDEGTTGHEIVWKLEDTNPGDYYVYRNGSEVDSGSWSTSPENVTVNIDGLDIGYYNYTIVVTDSGSNEAKDTVFVTVSDLSAPTISSPDDIDYPEGDTGNSISWTISDSNPSLYTVYRNGTIIESDTWTTSPEDIIIDIDGLDIGVYNYTLSVKDDYGNEEVDTVIVEVLDVTVPILNSPEDIEYDEGATGNEISWIASDAHPFSYVLYRNGTSVETGDWITTPVTFDFNVDGLTAGTYNYTLVVFDTSGNYASDSVLVFVEGTGTDTTPTTPTTTADLPFDIVVIMQFIIIIGSLGTIVVIATLACRARKSGQWQSQFG